MKTRKIFQIHNKRVNLIMGMKMKMKIKKSTTLTAMMKVKISRIISEKAVPVKRINQRIKRNMLKKINTKRLTKIRKENLIDSAKFINS